MQAGGGYQRSQNWSKALEAAKRSRNERFGPNQDWTQFSTQFFHFIFDSRSSSIFESMSTRFFDFPLTYFLTRFKGTGSN